MLLNNNRRLILFYFCCANILISFNISALIATVPAIARSLDVDAGDVAGIVTYYMIPYGLCALGFVPLACRFSIKSLLIFSASLFSLGNWICLWSDSLTVIMAGRILSGIAAAAVTPLGLITLGKIFPTHLRGRVIGIFFSSAFFGSIFGLILSAVAHWHWQFIIPFWLGLILAIGLFFCPKDGMEAHSVKVDYFDAFRIPGLRRLLVLIFFMSLFFHGVVKWYGVYLDKIYSYSQVTISGLIILTAFASMLGQLIGGIITDKLGRLYSCYIGTGLLGLCVVALYWQYSFLILSIVFCLISVGWTIAHNGISTVLTDFSDKFRMELAALNSAVRFFSGGLGFWLSGNFVQRNFGLTFLMIGILMLTQMLFISKIVSQRKES